MTGAMLVILGLPGLLGVVRFLWVGSSPNSGSAVGAFRFLAFPAPADFSAGFFGAAGMFASNRWTLISSRGGRSGFPGLLARACTGRSEAGGGTSGRRKASHSVSASIESVGEGAAVNGARASLIKISLRLPPSAWVLCSSSCGGGSVWVAALEVDGFGRRSMRRSLYVWASSRWTRSHSSWSARRFSRSSLSLLDMGIEVVCVNAE